MQREKKPYLLNDKNFYLVYIFKENALCGSAMHFDSVTIAHGTCSESHHYN